MPSRQSQPCHKGYHWGAAWIASALAAVSAGLGGCVSVTPAPAFQSAGTPGAAIGDRDDIWAAVTASVTRSEMAVIDVIYEPGRRTYLLATIRDETAKLVFIGEGLDEGDTLAGPSLDGADGPSGPIEMICTIGLRGDPPREERLMRDVAHRLERLRGVDARPITW